ncbi:MAG: hypothetical protein EBU97_06160, partial [Rhodobacteraceae bacterium]|nr:hypothetical protein [Paracoccaceae bacterium]
DGAMAASVLNGGDGGHASITNMAVSSAVHVSNARADLQSERQRLVTLDSMGKDYNSGKDATASNIQFLSNGTGMFDAAAHLAETRVGHVFAATAIGGLGGDATEPSGTPTIGSKASLSAQGGAGGDADVTIATIAGDLTVEAENSVILKADHAGLSAAKTAVSLGHSTETKVYGGAGGLGGKASDENLYDIYAALSRLKTAGKFGDLTGRDLALVQPVLDYFGVTDPQQQPNGAFGAFLQGLIYGARDTDATTVIIPELTKDEQTALLAIMGASGHGGNATDSLGDPSFGSLYGAIEVTADTRDLTDSARGITVTALDTSDGTGSQSAAVGHRNLVTAVKAGDGGDVRAYQMGLTGDGGNANLTVGGYQSDVNLTSAYALNLVAKQAGPGGSETKVRVGHETLA